MVQQENRALKQQTQLQESKMRELKMSNQILLGEIQKYKDNEKNVKKRFN